MALSAQALMIWFDEIPSNNQEHIEQVKKCKLLVNNLTGDVDLLPQVGFKALISVAEFTILLKYYVAKEQWSQLKTKFAAYRNLSNKLGDTPMLGPYSSARRVSSCYRSDLVVLMTHYINQQQVSDIKRLIDLILDYNRLAFQQVVSRECESIKFGNREYKFKEWCSGTGTVEYTKWNWKVIEYIDSVETSTLYYPQAEQYIGYPNINSCDHQLFRHNPYSASLMSTSLNFCPGFEPIRTPFLICRLAHQILDNKGIEESSIKEKWLEMAEEVKKLDY